MFQDSSGESHPVRIWFLLFLLSTAAAAERFRLRFIRAADIIPVLSRSHSRLKFLQCPGGFKVHGTAEQIRLIRKELARLDVPQVERWVEIKYGSREEILSLLATLTAARVEPSGEYHLSMRGNLGDVEQALELLEQLDKQPDKLTVELQVVLDTPEVKQSLGPRWAGEMMDEQPEVKHWVPQVSAEPLWVPVVGRAESADFVKAAPWVLSCSRLQVLSGDDISLGANEDGSERGVRWNLVPNFKQDGYVVMKVMPRLTNGYVRRTFLSDARLKLGETIVLAGLGRAEELDLAGEGPILLMITVKQGW